MADLNIVFLRPDIANHIPRIQEHDVMSQPSSWNLTVTKTPHQSRNLHHENNRVTHRKPRPRERIQRTKTRYAIQSRSHGCTCAPGGECQAMTRSSHCDVDSLLEGSWCHSAYWRSTLYAFWRKWNNKGVVGWCLCVVRWKLEARKAHCGAVGGGSKFERAMRNFQL